MLQNYQNLNHTGFRKILKKHDKLLKVDIGGKWQKEKVEASHFFVNRDIDKIINETETTVTSDLEAGDRQRAMKRLRVPPLGKKIVILPKKRIPPKFSSFTTGEQQSPWTTFKVGLFSGSFVVLFVAVILSAIFYTESPEQSDLRLETLKIAFRLYRAPLLIIMFVFLIGINIYGWRSAGCNHVLIFELDPRNHLSEQHLMELASIFGVSDEEFVAKLTIYYVKSFYSGRVVHKHSQLSLLCESFDSAIRQPTCTYDHHDPICVQSIQSFPLGSEVLAYENSRKSNIHLVIPSTYSMSYFTGTHGCRPVLSSSIC